MLTDDTLELSILPPAPFAQDSELVTTGPPTIAPINTAVTQSPAPEPITVTTPLAEPEITSVPTPTPLPPIGAAPALLSIPTIGLLNSPVQKVGIEKIKQADGSVAARWQARDAGVGYQPAGQGEICKWGLITLNGHNWFRQKPAIFVNLHNVKTGDKITLSTDAGLNCEYTVEWTKQYGPLDTSWLYEAGAISNPDLAYLNIYTCSADFKERYVVRASMPKSPTA